MTKAFITLLALILSLSVNLFCEENKDAGLDFNMLHGRPNATTKLPIKILIFDTANQEDYVKNNEFRIDFKIYIDTQDTLSYKKGYKFYVLTGNSQYEAKTISSSIDTLIILDDNQKEINGHWIIKKNRKATNFKKSVTVFRYPIQKNAYTKGQLLYDCTMVISIQDRRVIESDKDKKGTYFDRIEYSDSNFKKSIDYESTNDENKRILDEAVIGSSNTQRTLWDDECRIVKHSTHFFPINGTNPRNCIS